MPAAGSLLGATSATHAIASAEDDAAPPVGAGPRKADPDNLVEALGLRPVVPETLAPFTPVQPVQPQALTGGGADPRAFAQLSAPSATDPGQGGTADPATPLAAAPSSAATQPIAATGMHTSAADPSRQVAMRLKRAVNSGEDILTIELHPAELGRVSVRLGFHEGRVDVRLVVDRQETFDAFSHDRAALEQQLAQAGIDLGGGGLDLRYGGGSASPEAPTASAATSAAASSDPVATTRQIRLPAEGLVDIVA